MLPLGQATKKVLSRGHGSNAHQENVNPEPFKSKPDESLTLVSLPLRSPSGLGPKRSPASCLRRYGAGPLGILWVPPSFDVGVKAVRRVFVRFQDAQPGVGDRGSGSGMVGRKGYPKKACPPTALIDHLYSITTQVLPPSLLKPHLLNTKGNLSNLSLNSFNTKRNPSNQA